MYRINKSSVVLPGVGKGELISVKLKRVHLYKVLLFSVDAAFSQNFQEEVILRFLISQD